MGKEKNNPLISFEEFQDKYIGEKGSQNRLSFDVHADKVLLGTLIARLRKSHQLTQEELAQKIQNKQEYISRIESGKTDIRLSTFLKILNILDIKLMAIKE